MPRTKQSADLDSTKMGFRTLEFQESLTRGLIGQPHAIDGVLEVYNQFINGMCMPNRPIGNFLLAGPTGSGKTRLVELIGETLLKKPYKQSVVKIDCAEFQENHEIAKIIGSPPGYLGHRETIPLLSQAVIDSCFSEDGKISIILFDEIEKAAPNFFKLLLGILDKATLTLGDNRKVDFSRCFIFMTSNLGMKEAEKRINNPMGFAKTHTKDTQKLTDTIIHAEIKRKFQPEFINRLDKVIIFRPLEEDSIKKILEIELNMIRENMAVSLGVDRYFTFDVTSKAKDFIILKGVDKDFGARFLKRTINTLLMTPFSNLIGSEQVGTVSKDHIIVDYKEGEKLSFRKGENKYAI